MTKPTHHGGCHCGAVRFSFQLDTDPEAKECNCSMCARHGFLHLIVPASQFQLVQGKDKLTTYTFGTHTAQHYFCSVCGIESYYVPRSNPDGFSINYRCVDSGTLGAVTITPFDGQNWEKQPSLSHLSA